MASSGAQRDLVSVGSMRSRETTVSSMRSPKKLELERKLEGKEREDKKKRDKEDKNKGRRQRQTKQGRKTRTGEKEKKAHCMPPPSVHAVHTRTQTSREGEAIERQDDKRRRTEKETRLKDR